jgi:L,D-peptidoglycan transpeptidase YkuD (ErfK/YbiS/YcfS/YnhG family)
MDILVQSDARGATRGWLCFADRRWRCALGRSGVRADKREGDGATPQARIALRRVLYRPDRLPPPETRLPVRALTPRGGWCDDPAARDYNRFVTLPHAARYETLWREDAIYDVIVELGWNDDPVVPGKGSAIFLHVARPGYAPTEGCVALALEDLLHLLRAVAPTDMLCIEG